MAVGVVYLCFRASTPFGAVGYYPTAFFILNRLSSREQAKQTTITMNDEFNLEPLQELFSTELDPEDLAHELDELAYYFSLTSLWIYEYQSDKWFTHEDTHLFVYRLKQLRDALLRCSVQEECKINFDFQF